MSSPSSNQNIDRPENAPEDPMQVPEVPADDNVPAVPLQSPEVHAAMEPANANVPEVQANANVPADPVQQPPVVLVEGPADDNVPGEVQGACAPQNESSSGSSDEIFEEYLPHMVRANLNLSNSSPATSSTLGSSKTPTLSTDMEERSSLTGTPSSEGSGEGGEVTALTSEQMIKEIVDRLPDSKQQKSKMDVDSQNPKEAPKGTAGDAKEPKPIQLAQVKAVLSNIPRLPPLHVPSPVVQSSPRPQQRSTTTLPPIAGAAVPPAAIPRMKSSVAVLPPVTGATGGGHQPPCEKSGGLSKQSSDSSLSTTSESVESDSPKKPTHSSVEALRRRDSSDGSKADESSVSAASPELHKKKALHKKVHKESSATTPSLKAIRDMPTMSRADTLEDVDTIKTDSISFHSNPSPFARPLSPDRDRRAISLPADPPRQDPAMAPDDRRAYSEAKAADLEVIPIPPPQSLDTSISWHSSDPIDPLSGVRSEPVMGVTVKDIPARQAISEPPLHLLDQSSSINSPRVPQVLMEEDQTTEVDQYAPDMSSSNSDFDPRLRPRKQRPRRGDSAVDNQVLEFNQAIAEAQRVSSGRGTDSNPPTSTLASSSERRVAAGLAGYGGWLQPQNFDEEDDGASQSGSSQSGAANPDPSGTKSSSDSSSDQNLLGCFGSGFLDQSGAGPSGVGKTPQVGMDTLAVIPEKGESLSPSSMTGSLSPAEMEGIEDLNQDDGEGKKDVAMVESDPKSRLGIDLKGDDSPRTPKRKREPKKSTDDSPKDPELLSPGQDSKKYCSEFSRPVVAGQIVRSSSTGSVKPDQVQRVDIESLKKLAEKKAKETGKAGEKSKSEKDPKDESKKDPKDKQEPSA